MGSMVGKLVIFSILLNLAAGIMMTAVVDTNGNRVFDSTDTGVYNSDKTDNYSEAFNTEFEEDIKPAGSVEDEGDQIYRVMDTMSLGFVYKFVNIVDEYMFGFVNILDNTFGQYLKNDLRAILFGNDNPNDLIPNKFGAFKIVISISYILMGIELLAGKKVVEE